MWEYSIDKTKAKCQICSLKLTHCEMQPTWTLRWILSHFKRCSHWVSNWDEPHSEHVASARLITLPTLHLQALCCVMATSSCVGQTKEWSSETSTLWPRPLHLWTTGCGLHRERTRRPKCSHNNGSKWLDTQKPTLCLVRFAAQLLLNVINYSRAETGRVTDSCDLLDTKCLSIYLSNGPLTIFYDLFIHFPLITPATHAGL